MNTTTKTATDKTETGVDSRYAEVTSLESRLSELYSQEVNEFVEHIDWNLVESTAKVYHPEFVGFISAYWNNNTYSNYFIQLTTWKTCEDGATSHGLYKKRNGDLTFGEFHSADTTVLLYNKDLSKYMENLGNAKEVYSSVRIMKSLFENEKRK